MLWFILPEYDTELKLVQPLNTLSPIDVTLLGIFTEANLSQDSNALLPIEVTFPGIIIDFNSEQV